MGGVSFYSVVVLRAARIGVAIAIAIAAGIVTAAPSAHARPRPTPARVVLADPDPELLRALQSTLAPWRLEVIADPTPPADEDDAAARAFARRARFIVWRQEGGLYVLDRERGATDERDAAAGPLDPVAAASAALSVKTLMRLPPPPPPDDAPADDPAGRGRLELRGQATVAARVALGSTAELGGRILPALLVRPLPQIAWRIGVTADVGSPTSVQRASFKGTWSDWAVVALTSFAIHGGRWEVEPELGAGVTRSSLEGTEMSTSRNEIATLGLLRAGVTARRRFGRWTVGGGVIADRVLGTPTYTRTGSSAEIFRVPAFSIAVGTLAAADFGASW